MLPSREEHLELYNADPRAWILEAVRLQPPVQSTSRVAPEGGMRCPFRGRERTMPEGTFVVANLCGARPLNPRPLCHFRCRRACCISVTVTHSVLRVPPGSITLASTLHPASCRYHAGVDPAAWGEDALDFKPGRPPDAHLNWNGPFGGSAPRQCPGEAFSVAVSKAMLDAWVSKFGVLGASAASVQVVQSA